MNYKKTITFDYFDFLHTRDENPAQLPFHSHIHECYELLYFVSVDGVLNVEGTDYSLVPGSILITRPGEFHQLTILSDHPYERYSFRFYPQSISAFDPDLEMLAPFHNRLLGERNHYVSTDAERQATFEPPLNSEPSVDIPAELARARVYSLFVKLLCDIYSEFIRNDNASHDRGNGTNPRAQAIINYINNHLSGDLSRNELSKQFFLSESQINRLIKKSTGLSAGQYITLKRMHLARKLFIEGQSIRKVCDACGFNSYPAFFIAYKKHFGRSPTNDFPTIDQHRSSP